MYHIKKLIETIFVYIHITEHIEYDISISSSY